MLKEIVHGQTFFFLWHDQTLSALSNETNLDCDKVRSSLVTNYKVSYPWFIVVCVSPIPMELDDIGVFQLCQILEHQLDLLLLSLEVLPLRELHFVPNDLNALFGVHCEICAVDARHIPLLNLE